MNKYKIAVSCVGSGVGQSVINSCRLSRLPLYTVGLGMNPFAYGAYDCDCMDYAPNIYEGGYIDRLIDVLKKHQIDLVIPGLDDEALIFSKAMEQFERAGIKVIASDTQLIALCRDKELMSNELNPIVNVFVKSYDKAGAVEALSKGEIDFPLIAKPRGGYASRGIEIIRNEDDIAYIEGQHIVQELAIPGDNDPNYGAYIRQINKRINSQVSEISIQLVTDPNGDLISRMASFNKLNNGVPIEIVPYENEEVWGVVDRLYPVYKKMGLRGPLNIQGRLTNNGLKLFEMNPRFTGITGLRAVMGFNEVEACIKAWLGLPGAQASLRINQNNFGMRQTADKVVPLERNAEASQISVSVNQQQLKTKKTVLVTGAGGYLGRNLIKELLADDGYEIQALDLSKEALKKQFTDTGVECFDLDDLKHGRMSLGQVDRLIHCAFGRPHCAPEQVADSLAFTSELFTHAVTQQVPAVINISSQSVYGLGRSPLWREDIPAAPDTPYGQAKYATELMVRSGNRINNHLRFTSLRLGALSGGVDGFVPLDMLGKFAKKALLGDAIHIVGGTQRMERLDVRDAIGAILALLKVDPVEWDGVYNIGPGEQHNICDLAEKTAQIAADLTGGPKSEIIVEKKDISMEFGMDISKIRSATGWSPYCSINDTIQSVVEYMQEKYGENWVLED